MATFYGSKRADRILPNSLSPGVTSDPAGLGGTADDVSNIVFGYGGADRIVTGAGDDEVHGGAGNDRIYGGGASDEEYLYGDAGSDLLVSGDNNGALVFLNGGTGADRMIGGNGQQFFFVDSYLDVVRDYGDQEGDEADTIVTNLRFYKLGENAGVDNLDFVTGGFFGMPDTKSVGIGNSKDNGLTGNDLCSILNGRGGNDWVRGGGGDDIVLGGGGDDDVQGEDGNDIVRGQNGNDSVWGGYGIDTLIGGRGDDTFFFNYTSESPAGTPDVICRGDHAAAFEGAGAAGGDLIWLPNAIGEVDGNIVPLDFDAYEFGGTGKGSVSFIDRGIETILRANLDDDPAMEFKVVIRDGAVQAADYTADDLVFSI